MAKTIAILCDGEGGNLSLSDLTLLAEGVSGSVSRCLVARPLSSEQVVPPGCQAPAVAVVSMWGRTPARLQVPTTLTRLSLAHFDVDETIAWDRPRAAPGLRFKAMHFWSRLPSVTLDQARTRYGTHAIATALLAPDVDTYQQNFVVEHSPDRPVDGISELSWSSRAAMVNRPEPFPGNRALMDADIATFLDLTTRVTLEVEEWAFDESGRQHNC